MKNKFSLFLLPLCLTLLGSCSTTSQNDFSSNENDSASQERLLTVGIIDNDNFSVDESFKQVPFNGRVYFDLTFKDSMSFHNCNYEKSTFIYLSEGKGRLYLDNVTFSQRITVSCVEEKDAIYYDLNGGTFYEDNLKEYSSYKVSYDTTRHPRPNTELGNDLFSREGYVLTGWNTMADGSGTHYGIGSKVTLEEGKCPYLYAEWRKALNKDAFTYEKNDTGITLLKYNGENTLDEFVIPEMIDGQYVTKITNRFAMEVKADCLVLPSHLFTLTTGAFFNCDISEIYFYDNITAISDSCFYKTKFTTWHINAIQKPKFFSSTDLAHFSDSLDNYIVSKDEKNIIVFAGCSMCYGMKSEKMEEYLNYQYGVYDLGVIGGTNAAFQLNAIAHFIKSGDILIHAPEESSPFQLMENLMAEARMFANVEADYDLLSYSDMSQFEGSFNAFSSFNIARESMEPITYTSYNASFTPKGDINKERAWTGEDESFSDGEYTYRPDYVNDTSFSTLASFYDKMRDKGADVYFSYAPVNYSNLTSQDKEDKIWNTFAFNCETQLKKNDYAVISTVSNYLLDGRYFYDTDYHLNDDGALLRTKQLTKDLANYLSLPYTIN